MKSNASSPVARISLAVSALTVREALVFARSYCDANPVDLNLADRLAMIVEELVMNIIEHGGAADRDRIGLALESVTDGLSLTVTDSGNYFDPRTTDAPDMPPERGGGAGIALVRAWSRIERYVRIDGENVLQLVIPHS
jgi:serine/threonine-protein kinase RsbW